MKRIAVIVTFNPEEDIIKNVEIISGQVDKVLIVDNGSVDQFLEYLERVERHENVDVLRNKTNLGIATALNLGLAEAIHHEYEWLITLDQDSTVTEGYVNRIIQTSHHYKEDKGIEPVLVSPTYLHPEKETVYAKEMHHNDQPYVNIKTAMTSGNLINLRKLKESGVTFKDEYFIDYVDHEFCLNLDNKGYHIIQSSDAILYHSLGNITEFRLFNKKMIVTNHNPVRRYFMTRNRFDMYKTYRSANKEWVKEDFSNFLMDIVKICLFEERKRLKILNIIRGIKDANSHKMGPYKY